MMINMIDLEGNTKQYYNAKKVLDWTLNLGADKIYDIRLIYDEKGNLEGFTWKDEDPQALGVILALVKSADYAKLVPKTVRMYRQKHRDIRTVKVTATKSSSYSLYVPTTWIKELGLDDDGYVDMQYNGDGILIKKSSRSSEEKAINIDMKNLSEKVLVDSIQDKDVE